MNLNHLTNQDLHAATTTAAKAERLATSALLHHLSEVARRRLYAQKGYCSLYEYCVKALLMSEPQAARRVNAARLLEEFPEIEVSLNAGSLTLSNVSQAQVFFKKEKNMPKEWKREIIKKLENQSSRSAERIIAAQTDQPLPREKIKAVGKNHTELKIIVNEETMKDLERLKEIMATTSMGELLEKMARICCKKLDPLEKSTIPTPTSEEKKSNDVPNSSTTLRPNRYIPAKTKEAVWQRDQGTCTYIDPLSGLRCTSRYGLQLDHRHPFALGGQNTKENLRLLCRAHNQWHAIKSYGPSVNRHFSSGQKKSP